MKKAYLFTIFCVLSFLLVPLYLNAFLMEKEIISERELLEQVLREKEWYQTMLEERQRVLDYQTLGNIVAITSMFNEVAETLERAYRRLESEEVRKNHKHLKLVFNGIEQVNDRYLFYISLYHYLNRDWSLAKENLQRMVNEYSSSAKIRQAFSLLSSILIMEGLDQEYIDLYNRMSFLASIRQTYWLGHAYYNLGSYDQAVQIFTSLENNRDFGLRSSVMIGIIDYANNETERAIDRLLTLSSGQNQGKAYYDFVLLTLARLKSQIGSDFEALMYFQDYYSFHDGFLTPEELYEGALLARNASNDQLAISFLSKIIRDRSSIGFFDRALSQMAFIEADSGDLENSKILIQDALGSSNVFHQLIEYQYELLTQLREKVYEYVHTPGMNKSNLRDEINSIVLKLQDISRRSLKIDDIGFNETDLQLIGMITEEYSLLMEVFLQKDDFARQISLLPNHEFVQSLEARVSELDDARKELLVRKLLHDWVSANKKEWEELFDAKFVSNKDLPVTNESEQMIVNLAFAAEIAERIISTENRLFSAQGFQPKFEDLQQDPEVQSLYIEARTRLGNYDREAERLSQIEDELERVTELRFQLYSTKEEFGSDYHRAIAERLIRDNRNKWNDNDFVYDLGRSVIVSFSDDIARMTQEYNFTLLDIMFREAIKREQDFQRMRNEFEEGTASVGGSR